MKIARKAVLFVAVLLFFGVSPTADPINDGVFNAYKTGWFLSFTTPCPIVCKDVGARAEMEIFYSPTLENKYTYVCKIRASTQYGKGQLYGNNFSSPKLSRFCMASTPAGTVIRSYEFKCLCVIPMKF